VLIELGYLSNREDERDLRNPEWRAKAADSIVEAVEKFAGGRAHAGG
jgi:N-acetylmuramoyl-L-alanine amidase